MVRWWRRFNLSSADYWFDKLIVYSIPYLPQREDVIRVFAVEFRILLKRLYNVKFSIINVHYKYDKYDSYDESSEVAGVDFFPRNYMFFIITFH